MSEQQSSEQDLDKLLHDLEVLRQRWSHNVNFEATIAACIDEIELCIRRDRLGKTGSDAK